MTGFNFRKHLLKAGAVGKIHAAVPIINKERRVRKVLRFCILHQHDLLDENISILKELLEEVHKLNDKIADICSVNKSGTVFQDIFDELVHIKKTLGDIED